ncbi:UNVERIFIED_CONTAM: hypothetical protein HDU68_010986 [Siphonaria sp. JEL0065]|nr:hypothetical protein HDU68_010986 [Siphonaria sp. JEL0065]
MLKAAIAIHEISKKGFIVHVSSGNDGDAGPMSTSSPGVSRGAISIASFDNGELYVPVALTIGEVDYPATNSVAETTHFGPGTVLTDIATVSYPAFILHSNFVVTLIDKKKHVDADTLDVQNDGCTLASMNPESTHSFVGVLLLLVLVVDLLLVVESRTRPGAISCLIYFNMDGVVNTKITGVAQIPGIIMPAGLGGTL